MIFENTLEFARQLDRQDPLSSFRQKFHIPLFAGKPCIYFTGNSLGLQPVSAQDYIHEFLQDWANFGVEGHFHGKKPWLSYHEIFPQQIAMLTGALPEEVIVMNQLTVNLHLLLTTFYRPAAGRNKILCESKAFPSDQYALESQVRLHGLEPATTIIELEPRDGEYALRTEDILAQIEKHATELSLVMFGGVNYYSGEVLEMDKITEAAHRAGSLCGFDLAHAIGNIELKLHEWNIDFACWCSYKYLNSGPGGVAGAYIHQRHIRDTSLPRLAGWWGHEKSTRFRMEKGFKAIPTAEGWQLSNAPVLSMAAHKASLDVFEEAGMEKLFAKSRLLSAYTHFILEVINGNSGTAFFEVITPADAVHHGSQLSLIVKQKGKQLFTKLQQNGVVSDWREPDVIRIAPVPLYNSFEDVYRFGQMLKQGIEELLAEN